jgi:hypothetical protein
MDDIYSYHWAEKEFKGSSDDAREWWTNVRGSDDHEHVLKSMALILHGLVPHAAEVERLFSSLGAIQGDYRTSLKAQTFEQLGMLRSYLTSIVKVDAIEHGKVVRRTSAQVKQLEMRDNSNLQSILSYSNSYYGHFNELYDQETVHEGVGSQQAGASADGDDAGSDDDDSPPFPPTITSSTPLSAASSSELKKPSAFYNFKELGRILEGRAQETNIDSTIIPHRVVGQDSNWSVEELTEVLGLSK